MRKFLSRILLLWIPVGAFAQSAPLNSFSNSGGSILSNGTLHPMHIGVIGQPIASGNTSGTLVVSSLMYAKDLHPPVITYNPSTLSLRLGSENTIQYQATDNNQIISSKLFYRPIGKIGSFDSVEVTSPVTNTFSKTILPAWHDMIGMEYFIKVKDKENTTRHPAGTERHFAYITHPSPQIPTTLLSYGRTKNNYRIIAIPFITSSAITQIFKELGDSDKSKYRIFKYESGEFKEYPEFTTVARAAGYFIIMSDVISNTVLSMPEMQAPPDNQSKPFELELKPGWNLIGNPYTIAINWDDVLVFNNNPAVVGAELKIWTGNGSYSNVKDLSAYQGAFVWNNGTQPLKLSIPFKGQRTPSGGRTSEEDENSDSWKINLVLHDGAEKNSIASFGMHTKADLSFDNFDDLNPPALEKFPVIQFPHPEHPQKYFVRDFVPYSESHSWLLEIPTTSANDRYLDWSIPDLSAIPSDVLLYDVSGNSVVNMKTQSFYTFPASAQTFKVLFGPDNEEKIHPEKITVLPPHPNPVTAGTDLVFSIGLPKADRNYPVHLEIFDGVGRAIRMHDWSLSPGLHEIKLSADQTTRPIKGDVSYYTLEIGHARFNGKLLFKP